MIHTENEELYKQIGLTLRKIRISNKVTIPKTAFIEIMMKAEMVAVRRLIRVLQRRAAILSEDSLREEFLSEEWWRCVNEVEIIQDTIQAIRRAFRRN